MYPVCAFFTLGMSYELAMNANQVLSKNLTQLMLTPWFPVVWLKREY
jgi:hypothetical protein